MKNEMRQARVARRLRSLSLSAAIFLAPAFTAWAESEEDAREPVIRIVSRVQRRITRVTG